MIRFGLGAVKGVGEGAVEVIKQARDEGGPFLSLFDFCKRVDGRKVNRKVLEALVKSGAFDGVAAANGVTRAKLFARHRPRVERAAAHQREKESGQTSLLALFGGGGSGKDGGRRRIERGQVSRRRRVVPQGDARLRERGLGFYISGHPLDRYLGEIKKFTNATTANCIEKGVRAEVTLAGIVANYQERPMKSGAGKYAFFTLEDHFGQIEFIVNSKKVEEYREILGKDDPLLVFGTVDAPFGDGEAARERLRFNDAKLLSECAPEELAAGGAPQRRPDQRREPGRAGEAAAQARRPLQDPAEDGDPQAQRVRPGPRRRLQGRRHRRSAGAHRAAVRRPGRRVLR